MKKELTKGDVYVVVDTPKKAKKLKKMLDMFGESYLKTIKDPFRNCFLYFDSEGYYDTSIYKDGCYTKCKSEVSIKELRNILAREHLKEDDVIALGYGKSVEYLGVFKSFNNGYFEVKRYLSLNSGSGILMNESGCIKNFIRYATESEKELLRVNSLKEQAKEVIKPVSEELEVGKWYFIENKDCGTIKTDALIYIQDFKGDDNKNYGFNSHGEWTDMFWADDLKNMGRIVEATPQEVEKALIEEAKRRGFVNGGVGNNSNIHDKKLENCELLFNKQYEFDEEDNLLRVILDDYATWTVFKDGKWATIIEQPTDKFAELKEAHRNGKVMQMQDMFGGWHDVSDDSLWLTDKEYRIKPEGKPQVGDLVKAWDNDERDFIIGKLNDIDDSIYPFTAGSTGFKNAKKITPQEAMELLTDYCR